MMPGDIVRHILQSQHLYGLLQQGVFPDHIESLPLFLPRYLSLKPVVEASQHPPNARVHHQGICVKDQDGLYNGQIEADQLPGICALLSQYL